MNESLNNLTAYVSVRSIGGTSLYAGNANIRAESVGQFASTPVDSRTAIGKLVDLGFKVAALSPITVRVNGPAKLFQKHFGLKFEKKQTEITEMYTPTEKTEANCLDIEVGGVRGDGVSAADRASRGNKATQETDGPIRERPQRHAPEHEEDPACGHARRAEPHAAQPRLLPPQGARRHRDHPERQISAPAGHQGTGGQGRDDRLGLRLVASLLPGEGVRPRGCPPRGKRR